jgi:hypothetical protein
MSSNRIYAWTNISVARKLLRLLSILHCKRQAKAKIFFIASSEHILVEKSRSTGTVGSCHPTRFSFKKPQLLFKRKAENDDLPWHPTLSHKYHAKVPLGYEYRDSDVDFTGDARLM